MERGVNEWHDKWSEVRKNEVAKCIAELQRKKRERKDKWWVAFNEAKEKK